MSDEVPVQIKSMIPMKNGVAVMLYREDKTVAIMIENSMAATIVSFVRGQRKRNRVQTHDLLKDIFQGLGITAARVVINDLREDVFYARIFLTQENELGRNVLEVEARPGDALVIAAQQRCPIYFVREVWDKAEDAGTPDEKVVEDEQSKVPTIGG